MSQSFSILDFGSWLVVFIFSLTAHEAAHASAAKRLGDLTAYQGGQVTLDPIPHIRREPLGMLIIPIASYLSSGWMFGWASAPFNFAWAQQYPRRAAVMAFAGPAANFCIAAASWILLKAGLLCGFFQPAMFPRFSELVVAPPGLLHLLAILLSIACLLNLLLGIFNLLPLPPLDGSAFPLFFLPTETAAGYQRFMRASWLVLPGIFIAWQIFPKIWHPILRALVSTLS